MRRLLFLMISLCAMLTLWPVMPLVAQTTVVSGGGAATSVSAAAFPLLAPSGTVAAPSYAFSSQASTGLYFAAGAFTIAQAGTSHTAFPADAIRTKATNAYEWSSGAPDTVGPDLRLFRDAANTLAQRNSTNAQTFNIYNTFTDASNYERGTARWDTNVFELATQAAGSGTLRSMKLALGATTILSLGTSAVTSTVNVLPNANDTLDLANGTAVLWRNLFLTRSTQGSKTKALADAVATQFVRVAIPQTMGSNYAGGQVIYTVYARDATTGTQTLSGIAEFACINNAGTESCAAIVETYKTAAVVTGGTLTCAITAVTGLTDEIALAANCDTSLTSTALNIQYRLDMPQPNTVTPQ